MAHTDTTPVNFDHVIYDFEAVNYIAEPTGRSNENGMLRIIKNLDSNKPNDHRIVIYLDLGDCKITRILGSRTQLANIDLSKLRTNSVGINRLWDEAEDDKSRRQWVTRLYGNIAKDHMKITGKCRISSRATIEILGGIIEPDD